MSKYTTEVRFICEELAKNTNTINQERGTPIQQIDASWDKIFTKDAPFFDEAYRPILCKKILKHFYTREIGAETVGLWTLWMNTRLEEIMPYYNQLYLSELIKFNPMYDVDLTTTSGRDLASKTTEISSTNTHNTGNDSGRIQDNGHSSENGSDNTATRNYYSDTPQGVLDAPEGGIDVGQNPGVEKLTYLTNARKILGNGSRSSTANNDNTRDTNSQFTSDGQTDGNRNGTHDTTESFVEHIVGKRGTETFSGLLLKFRETFLNIDMMVIEEFNDLFMQLW